MSDQDRGGQSLAPNHYSWMGGALLQTATRDHAET